MLTSFERNEDLVLLDRKGRVVLLRTAPRGSRTEIAGQVGEAMDALAKRAGKKAKKSNRGEFKSLSFGLSMGCGQQVSGWFRVDRYL